jgi:putative multiple sugar transport system ATP-binding protein
MNPFYEREGEKLSNYILEMRNITKVFPGVKALENVNLAVKEGEIHAVVGENGAGKSTLMNILSGIFPFGEYEGEIYMYGEEKKFHHIKAGEEAGISIIHQELSMMPNLSVAENVFVGNEISKGIIVNWNLTYKRAEDFLKRVGYKGNIYVLVKDISVGDQQLVEIAKALSKNVRLLILDEPTSALNDNDAEHLLDILLNLKREGVTSIIISHKLEEIRRIADRITILRDGKVIETLDKNDDISQEKIIRGMVGRDIPDIFPKRVSDPAEIMFETRAWNVFDPLDTKKQKLFDIDIKIKKGEIVGLAGLMGAGRTEFALSVFGKSYGSRVSGTVYKEGKPIDVSNSSSCIENGIAYTTEDRKGAGLILSEDIKDNTVLVHLWDLAENGIRNKQLENKAADEQIEKLNVRCSGLDQQTVNLSGGNQQKVVLAKWILSEPDILILDEPTRGIDVGAKREIFVIMNNLVAQGKSILFISSELTELLGMCDRIYVMNEGRLVGELHRNDFSQEAVMKFIMDDYENRKGRIA